MEFKSLEVTRTTHVATVTLIGPGKGNALGPDFWREMPEAFDELDRDEEVRAVVVCGRGGNLTYGLDLKASAAFFGTLLAGENLARERMRLHDTVLEWQEAFNAIVRCRKPVVAAIEGWCIGGGVNLIAACDIRVCSADAKFSLREPRIAITPDLGALQRLPSIIGEGATRLMAFTAGDYDADFALRCGLVDEIYSDGEALKAGADAIAQQIAANAPLAVQGAKRVLEFARDNPTAAALEYVATWNAAFLQSRDLGEAVTAFMERRDPTFRGE